MINLKNKFQNIHLTKGEHSLGARIALRRTEAEDLELDISKRQFEGVVS